MLNTVREFLISVRHYLMCIMELFTNDYYYFGFFANIEILFI